jgi:hypothetical protein
VGQQLAAGVPQHHFMDVEQTGKLRLDAGLLVKLAAGRRRRPLAGLDMPAR